MKSSILLLAAVLCLLIAFNAFASSPPWTGTGTYTFDDTDLYFTEGSIRDTATVNISGSSFGELIAYQNSTVNMYAGTATTGISADESSIVNLYGGDINGIFIEFDSVDTATLNLFVDSYEFNPNSYLGYDQITGTWMNSNGDFDIIFIEGQFEHFNVIPEPATFILLTAGGLMLRRKK